MTFPQVVTPECFNRGSSPKFAWIPAKKHAGMTDSGGATNHHYAASCGELTPKRLNRSVNGKEKQPVSSYNLNRFPVDSESLRALDLPRKSGSSCFDIDGDQLVL